jgi:hypothetical protein
MPFLQRNTPYFISRHHISALYSVSHTLTAYKFNNLQILIFSQQRIQQLCISHCRSNKSVSHPGMTYTAHANVHILKYVQHMAGGALSSLRLRVFLFPACNCNNIGQSAQWPELSTTSISEKLCMTDTGSLLNFQVTSSLRK